MTEIFPDALIRAVQSAPSACNGPTAMIALVRFLPSGQTLRAEVHWYESHGIGKVEMKIKALL
ncbi:MAG: hypothetical protein FWD68_21500 [Alphaproteobacteria bacterium]|nr:hypothetical protein [Alphaproteobacteria bacterium]